jgi:hypothetical protein
MRALGSARRDSALLAEAASRFGALGFAAQAAATSI